MVDGALRRELSRPRRGPRSAPQSCEMRRATIPETLNLLRVEKSDVLRFERVVKNSTICNVAGRRAMTSGERAVDRVWTPGRGPFAERRNAWLETPKSLLLEMAAGVCFLRVAMGSNRPGLLLERQ